MRFSVQVHLDAFSTSRARQREESPKRCSVVRFLFFCLSSMAQSQCFFLFPSLSLSPSFSKQPLSSKTAERFELDLEAGSIVADLYDAAEKRLGE